MHDGLEVLSTAAPEWVVHVFTAINVFIAISYGLLALFFAKRLKLPGLRQANPLSVLACVGAMMFFIGCAHTHIDLAYWSGSGQLMAHWFSWWNVLSHLLQGVGGLTFSVLATFFLQVNIFDKKHYEKTLDENTPPTGGNGRSQSGDEPVDKR